MSTRRSFLKTMACGAAAITSASIFNRCTASAKRPNILFIMTDDHASHAMSCYGSTINKTPNLDRIANNGIRFTNCFCTNSICGPSRAVILTGKHSHINGFTVNEFTKFDPEQQTFPKLLRHAGYETAMIGKWHLGSHPTGFDYWKILPDQGDYYNPDFIEMGKTVQHQGYVTDIITDLAMDWLDNRDTDKPFMLMYQHKAPHRKWLPGPKHLTLYDDKEIPEPETLWDDYATRSDAAREQEMEIAEHMDNLDLKLVDIDKLREKENPSYGDKMFIRMTPEQQKQWEDAYNPKNEAMKKANLSEKELVKWKYQRYIKDYLRCVKSVDENVGRVLDYLKEKGLDKNTIVVYSSDQGFYLGDHGWFDKRFMYDTSMKMPLLMSYPAEIPSGQVSEELVSNLDFAETLLDYAGVPIPDDMQGASFRPICSGNTPQDWRDAVYYHYYEYPSWHMVKRHYGVRTSRYKLMHFYYDIDAWELYDLEKDPWEMNNVYGQAEYADIQETLHAKLKELRQQYGDSDELTQKALQDYLDYKNSGREAW